MFPPNSPNPIWAPNIEPVICWYAHLPAGSAGMTGFLGRVIIITCTGVPSQENMNKWFWNAVLPACVTNVQWHVQFRIDQTKVT